MLLFTRCVTSNASRHFKSPLAMGRDAFKPKHASSVSISEVIDTGVNSNCTIEILFHFLLSNPAYRAIILFVQVYMYQGAGDNWLRGDFICPDL